LEADNRASHSVYFDLQAGWGITKHIGGSTATRKLARLCRVDESSNVLIA